LEKPNIENIFSFFGETSVAKIICKGRMKVLDKFRDIELLHRLKRLFKINMQKNKDFKP